MKTNVKMNCPNCGGTINVDEILVSQFKDSIKHDLEAELSNRETKFNKQKAAFEVLQQRFDAERKEIDTIVNERVREQIQKRQEDLKNSIRNEIEAEKQLQLQALEEELNKKSGQLKDLNQTKAKLESLRREMEEAETRIILQKEKELSERLEQAKLSIKEQAQQESFLKIKEREKVIEDLKLKLEDAKRRAEQGSMQLQGEIQELEIIDILTEAHPFDGITQSKKGANAADILHIVRTATGAECGKIYYESKRTKTWSNDWVSKFKEDNLKAKADILILVTDALPKGIERYGIIDGVWICKINDVKELSLVLRYGLLKLKAVSLTQQGKETKMEQLYKYLTSEEFKNVFESILNGFKAIQESHQSEKLKMQRMWKEREKVLEQVLANSVDFYGSIKGIAGAEIPEVETLQYLNKAS